MEVLRLILALPTHGTWTSHSDEGQVMIAGPMGLNFLIFR